MSKIFPVGSVAVVLGSSGGIGRAIRDKLVKQKIFYDVISASRETSPKVDLKSERSIIDLAEAIKQRDRELGLVVDATGLLHNENIFPEKNLPSLRMGSLYFDRCCGSALRWHDARKAGWLGVRARWRWQCDTGCRRCHYRHASAPTAAAHRAGGLYEVLRVAAVEADDVSLRQEGG